MVNDSQFTYLLIFILTNILYLAVLESFKSPARSIDKPFRFSISDIFKGASSSGVGVSGRIASGLICVNDKIMICPTKEHAIVRSLTIDDMTVQTAFAGDQVSMTISGIYIIFIRKNTVKPITYIV